MSLVLRARQCEDVFAVAAIVARPVTVQPVPAVIVTTPLPVTLLMYRSKALLVCAFSESIPVTLLVPGRVSLGADRWEQLSLRPAEQLSTEEVDFLRDRFFHGHPSMRRVSPRYRELEAGRAAPAARPGDVDTPEHIVAAVYDVISGPAGPRDWDRFHNPRDLAVALTVEADVVLYAMLLAENAGHLTSMKRLSLDNLDFHRFCCFGNS